MGAREWIHRMSLIDPSLLTRYYYHYNIEIFIQRGVTQQEREAGRGQISLDSAPFSTLIITYHEFVPVS